MRVAVPVLCCCCGAPPARRRPRRRPAGAAQPPVQKIRKKRCLALPNFHGIYIRRYAHTSTIQQLGFVPFLPRFPSLLGIICFQSFDDRANKITKITNFYFWSALGGRRSSSSGHAPPGSQQRQASPPTTTRHLQHPAARRNAPLCSIHRRPSWCYQHFLPTSRRRRRGAPGRREGASSSAQKHNGQTEDDGPWQEKPPAPKIDNSAAARYCRQHGSARPQVGACTHPARLKQPRSPPRASSKLRARRRGAPAPPLVVVRNEPSDGLLDTLLQRGELVSRQVFPAEASEGDSAKQAEHRYRPA